MSRSPASVPQRDDARRAGAILLAAGHGPSDTRSFDTYWAPLAGAPLLMWSVAVFERAPEIAEILLVVSASRHADATALVTAQGWRRTRTLAAAAGSSLPDLLAQADAALSPDSTCIVVHDAARPLVTYDLLAAGLALVTGSPPVPAASAAIPVNETLKRVQSGIVVETPARAQLALLQTPHVFSRDAFRTALAAPPSAASAGDLADAVSLAVAAGLEVVVFPGAPANIRVATPADLALAEALMHAR